MTRDELLGIASLIGGVGLFSTVEVAGKIIGMRVHPVVLTFIRFSLTGIVLIALSIPLLRLRIRKLTLEDYGVFLLNGTIGITLALSLYHIALLILEKAVSAAVIISVNPVFVIICARFINKEAWRAEMWIAACLGTGGVLCFALETGSVTAKSLTGLGLMLLAAWLFAMSVCISKRFVARYGAMVLMGYSSLFGSLLLLPFVAFHISPDSLRTLRDAWVPVLYLSVIGTTVAYVLYYHGLLNTSAQMGGMIFFLKPVLASLLAVAILGESVNTWMLAGMALIISGVALVIIRGMGDRGTARGAP
ncbi:MAG: DMT family transporter [Deltaproteobacteria bacterium]|nr:DMT family transporter [Deltaproteobacteria bacterium]